MLPWGHAAVGYLAYRGIRGPQGAPAPAAAVAVVVGSQAPDLVDKPLAWTVGVLPAGRSLGHSLLVMAALFAIASRVRAVRARPEPAAGFAVGAVSHALADAAGSLLGGGPRAASFLFWPVVPLPVHEGGYSILGIFLSLDPTPPVLAGVALTAVAVAVWLRDGAPGLGFVTRAVRPGRRAWPEQ